VKEHVDVVVGAVLVAGVHPVVDRPLPRERDHGRHEDEQVDRHPVQTSGAVNPPSGRLHDGVGVGRPPGRPVLDRQIDRHYVAPAAAQVGGYEVLARGGVAAAVNEHVGCRHRFLLALADHKRGGEAKFIRAGTR